MLYELDIIIQATRTKNGFKGLKREKIFIKWLGYLPTYRYLEHEEFDALKPQPVGHGFAWGWGGWTFLDLID